MNAKKSTQQKAGRNRKEMTYMENNEILMKVLEKLDALQKGQTRMEVRLENLEKGQANLEKGQMRTDITLDRLDHGQAAIKSQVSENTQILQALRENSRTHRAQLDNITVCLAHVRGRVVKVEKSVNSLRQDLNYSEIRTAKNWVDILELKKLKNG